ncbi:hypothetical protein [Actinoplanes sp. N902-109]|uniref:hypothetical protein n=1 Tax=Actinoplanes sp. (strain N902-109) TaxID=649831 RepID=UPI0003293E35|nr:hypothetical protein [Actinoplanes sp. N902-109]AGL16378.1 hypothetical protein L083_2868 [Actinoplanes sp. N902-109]
MNADLLRVVADRVRLVPDRHRVFDQDESVVQRVFRIGAPVLSALLDLGFPHRTSGTQRYYDELDLANAALVLRLPSPRYLAMRRWPEVLRAVVDDRPFQYDVEIAAACGWPGPGHPCDFHLAGEVLALKVAPSGAPGVYTLSREVGATGRTVEATPELRELFAEVSGVEFHFLPEALRADLSFLAETSLADCELATRFLVRRAAERGWAARRSYGLLLSSPYSLEHYWPEIELDGSWTAFDPHLINSLVRWEVLAPGEVSVAQVLNSAFYRVAEDWISLVEDAGRPAPVSLLTRRRPLTGSVPVEAAPPGKGAR